jgi:hypothetical protein
MTPEQVERRLAAYGAESLDDLTSENAEIILSKFESALSAQAGIATKGNENQERKEDQNAQD